MELLTVEVLPVTKMPILVLSGVVLAQHRIIVTDIDRLTSKSPCHNIQSVITCNCFCQATIWTLAGLMMQSYSVSDLGKIQVAEFQVQWSG